MPNKKTSKHNRLQRLIVNMAIVYDWLVQYNNHSRWGASGFPDLVLGKQSDLLVLEIKTGKAKPTKLQQAWLDCFTSNLIETHVVREKDIDMIRRRLQCT